MQPGCHCHMMTFHFSAGWLPEMGGLQYKTIQEPCQCFSLTILVKVHFNEILRSFESLTRSKPIFADETIKRCNNESRLTHKCRSHRCTCSPPWKPPRTSPSPPSSPRPPTPSCHPSPSSPLDVTLHLGFVLNRFWEVRAHEGCQDSHFWS